MPAWCPPKKTLLTEKKIGADDVGAPVQNRLSRASHRRLISLANLYLSQHKQKYTWKEEGNTGKCKHGRKQSTKVQGQNRPAQPKAGWINRTVWGNLLIQMKSKQNGLTTSLLASNLLWTARQFLRMFTLELSQKRIVYQKRDPTPMVDAFSEWMSTKDTHIFVIQCYILTQYEW